MSGTHHQLPWWRGGGRRAQPSKPRLLVSEMVDDTGVARWVTRKAVEQGLGEATGCYEVVGGRRIAVASMLTPPQRCCWGCQQARASPLVATRISGWPPVQLPRPPSLPAASRPPFLRSSRLLGAAARCPHSRGLPRLRCARVISAGHAFTQNLRRGHDELGVEEPLRVAAAFDELALAI